MSQTKQKQTVPEIDLKRPIFSGEVSGFSFGTAIKFFSIALLMAMLVGLSNPKSWTVLKGMSWMGTLLMLGYLVVLLAFFWYFLKGKTTLDASGIRQDWLWKKSLEWSDAKTARFMVVPYMSWLIPPRLVIRTHSGMYHFFNGGTAELHRAFAEVTVQIQVRENHLV